jgi:hypothetical protein
MKLSMIGHEKGEILMQVTVLIEVALCAALLFILLCT